MQLTYRGHRYFLTSCTSAASENITRMSYRGICYSPSLGVPAPSKTTISQQLIYRGAAYCRPF